jgi:hypothetical protein
MRYVIVIAVTALVAVSLTYLHAQEPQQKLGPLGEMRAVAQKLAGHPELGAEVEVQLAKDAQFAVPAPFKAQGAAATITSLRGRLVAFDEQWVGLESQTGARAWIPREHLALVLQEKPLRPPSRQEQPPQQ